MSKLHNFDRKVRDCAASAMLLATTALLILVFHAVSVTASILVSDGSTWVDFKGREQRSGKFSPPPPISASWKETDTTIFVGISSFRDKRCSDTLKHVFSRADHPERISVGLINHIHTENDHGIKCLEDYCKSMGNIVGKCKHENQITVMDVSFLDARGPGMTRVMQESLLGEQEFCLQADAHSHFVKGWDTLSMNEWGQANNEYAILSTKPPALDSDDKEVNHVCQATFTKYGMVRHLAPRKLRGATSPVLSPFWSAGFSFSKCHAMKKVPYDPNMHYIFDGEEYSRMARFWTKGYDVYSPTRVLVTHDYDDGHLGVDDKGNAIKSTSWAENGQTREYKRTMFDEAIKRVKTMLGQDLGTSSVGGQEASRSESWSRTAESLAQLTKYGLGTMRTLDQFIEFSGLDPKAGTILGDRCTSLEWIPFRMGPSHNGADEGGAYAYAMDPALDEGDAWGLAAEPAYAGGKNIPLTATGDIELVITAPTPGDKASIAAGGAATTTTATVTAVKTTSGTGASGGKLWALFAPVDWMVEDLVRRVESKRPGMGIKLTKVILLGLPLMALVLIMGYLALHSEDQDISANASPRRSKADFLSRRSPAEKMV